MLIVNKKYESLDSLLKTEADEIDEGITDKGFTKFKKSLKSSPEAELLSDSEVDNYSKAVTRYAHKQIMNSYDDFFNKHGIAEQKEKIIDVFLKNDNSEKLKEIIEEDGVVSESEFRSGSDLNVLCDGFKDEAKIIASWAGTADGKAVGPYEILLRMILKNGNRPKEGDVGIGSKTIEVKGTNGGKKGSSPAHPSFQGMESDKVIFVKIDEAFNSLKPNKKSKGLPQLVENPGSVNYTQENNIDAFNNLLKEYCDRGGKVESIMSAIVDGVSEQYAPWNKGGKGPLVSVSNEYMKILKSFAIKPTELRDLIGRMQVCAYCSHYAYFMVINSRNMHYLLVSPSDCVKKSNELFYGPIGILPTARPGVNIRYNG